MLVPLMPNLFVGLQSAVGVSAVFSQASQEVFVSSVGTDGGCALRCFSLRCVRPAGPGGTPPPTFRCPARRSCSDAADALSCLALDEPSGRLFGSCVCFHASASSFISALFLGLLVALPLMCDTTVLWLLVAGWGGGTLHAYSMAGLDLLWASDDGLPPDCRPVLDLQMPSGSTTLYGKSAGTSQLHEWAIPVRFCAVSVLLVCTCFKISHMITITHQSWCLVSLLRVDPACPSGSRWQPCPLDQWGSQCDQSSCSCRRNRYRVGPPVSNRVCLAAYPSLCAGLNLVTRVPGL